MIVNIEEFIPLISSWLARIPLLAIAAVDSPRTFVLTILASIVIQNLQGHVISPFVEGDQLDIDPLLVFVAVLVAASLGGAVGAFVAVPAAAIVDLVVQEVVVPRGVVRSSEAPPPQRRAARRHTHRESGSRWAVEAARTVPRRVRAGPSAESAWRR